MNKNFNINGSLTATGDINVQGNLNVNGSVATVNQETLTIKDNFIGINGNGTTLDTAGMAGIVAITGGEYCALKDGNYQIDFEKLKEALNLHITYSPDPEAPSWYDPYNIAGDEAAINKFNTLNLIDANSGGNFYCYETDGTATDILIYYNNT